MYIEVYSTVRGGKASVGSGFCIGGRLALSAYHVVSDKSASHAGRTVLVRNSDGLFEAEVIWSDVGMDVVLLEVRADGWISAPRARWGRPVTDGSEIPCVAIGFPDVQVIDAPDPAHRIRDTEHIFGTLNPLTMVKANKLAVTVRNRPLGEKKWGGMSGAAVRCGNIVVGIVLDESAKFSDRLIALPSSSILDDDGFKAAYRTATGESVPALESVEFQNIYVPPAVHPVPESPAALLRAEARTVRFSDVDGIRDDLVDWCHSDRATSIRLVYGKGGQGKTRIAVELIDHFRAMGWNSGFISATATIREIESLGNLLVPSLFVFDYAEARIAQVEKLLERLVGSNVPIRILLLARFAGEWLTDSTYQLSKLVENPHLKLERNWSSDVRAKLRSDAIADIGEQLYRVAGYTDVVWRAIYTELIESPGNSHILNNSDNTVLAIHEGALAELLQKADPVEETASEARQVLLDHEARYWRMLAGRSGLSNLSGSVLRGAIASATVWGAKDRSEAESIVRRIPGLSDVSENQCRVLAEFLGEAYPGDGVYWGGLQPDRLGEYLVVHSSAANDERLFDPAAGVASRSQLERALTVLSRAARDRPQISVAIQSIVEISGVSGIVSAIRMAGAIEHREPVLDAIDNALTKQDFEQGELEEIERTFPENTSMHAKRAAFVANRVIDTYGTTSESAIPEDRKAHAEALLRYAFRSRAVDAGAAVAAARLAEGICRALVAEDRQKYLPLLGECMLNLASRLTESDSRVEALRCAEAAAEIFGEVASGDRAAQLPVLAEVLLTIAKLNYNAHIVARQQAAGGICGDNSDALRRAYHAAVDAESIYVSLVARDRATYLSGEARSYDYLSLIYAELGNIDETLSYSRRAEPLLIELVERDSDSYSRILAALYYNRTTVLLENEPTGADALVAADKAVELFQHMADQSPYDNLSFVAAALTRRAFVRFRRSEVSDGVTDLIEAAKVCSRSEFRGVDRARGKVRDQYLARVDVIAEEFRSGWKGPMPDWLVSGDQ